MVIRRDQIAAFVGNDPQTIRAVEDLFRQAGETNPAQIDAALIAADSALAQARALADDVRGLAEGLLQAPPPREFARARYGQFYDTTTQTAGAINTAYPVTFNTASLSHGVAVVSGSRVTVDTPGIYDFQLSVQLDKTSGGTGYFYLWFRKNGVDVPDSASTVQVQGNNAEVFTGLNFFFQLGAGDYVELVWSVSDTSVQIAAFPAAAPVPAIPSIILTVSNNIEGVK